jgi:hypothetical protein
MIQELRHKNPSAVAAQQDGVLSDQKRDILITHVLNVFNSTGLTAQQAREVLEHLQVPRGDRGAGGEQNDALTLFSPL